MEKRKGKTLYDMAVRRLVQCKHQLEDIGDIPYAKIRPVLVKLELPEQLHTLETHSPHLLAHTSELWTNFLRRDIPKYDAKPVQPKDGKSWYELYCKLKKKGEEERREQELELMQKFQANQDERDRNQTTISSTAIHADRRRAAARQATTHAKSGNPSLLTFGGGSRTKTNTGAGVISKVRREMKERQTQMGVLAQMPSRAKPLPRPSTSRPIIQPQHSGTTHLSRQNSGVPSLAHPSASTGSTHRPLPRSANPLLSSNKKRSPLQRPSLASSAEPSRIQLPAPQSSSRPSQATPLKRKDSPGKGGIFMPSVKKRKV